VSTATYDEEVEFLQDSFEFEDCELCGYGLDGHTIGPDPLGHAHAYCKREVS
jgi:hypothetical protein